MPRITPIPQDPDGNPVTEAPPEAAAHGRTVSRRG